MLLNESLFNVHSSLNFLFALSYVGATAYVCLKMATIRIQSGKNNVNLCSKNSKVQSVPFKIHADCDAKVDKYFDKYVKTKEDGSLTGSFRGYPLRGKTVKIPESYVGLMLHESIRPSTEKDERNVYVVNNFKDIIFWNWDKVTSDNDSITQALQWIDIAEALHTSIVEE